MCASEPSPEPRRGLALLLLLFVPLRLMSLVWYQPLHVEVATFQFPFAYLQHHGLYPFFDYWLEHPPVLVYHFLGLAAAARGLLGAGSVAWQAACFVRAVQVSAVVWETGSLALIHLLVRRLRGERQALWACWVYIALFATGFVSASYLDNFPAFLLLAGVALIAHGRLMWSAMVLGIGFMTKVFPAALLPVLAKGTARWPRRVLAGGAFAVVVGLTAAPFVVAGRPWLRCGLECTMRRPPWETVWALLEGQYEFGYVGPQPSAFDPAYMRKCGVTDEQWRRLLDLPPSVYLRGAPEAKEGQANADVNRALLARHPRFRVAFYGVASHFATDLHFIGPPMKRPWLYAAVGVAFALLYLWVFARLPAELSPERRVLFAAFTVLLFFLYSKGWSPQFVAYVIPLFLIVFPTGEAVLWCLLLSVTAFLEMPVWAVYVHGRPGLAALDRVLLQVAVLGRTAILAITLGRIYRRLLRK
ncbi:DUF2029 domain-containing protein [bacterium]|nr:DUF2029 domain-containing protein [bacterium]